MFDVAHQVIFSAQRLNGFKANWLTYGNPDEIVTG